MQNIAIIGGGAAGFFAAISAKTTQPDATVTVFEKTGRVLAKVGVSGGGRCNLTNSFADITDLKHTLTSIAKQQQGKIEVHFKDKTSRTFDRVIITTGGSPRAVNLQYLEAIGNKIEMPVPSLFTFNITEKAFCNLMGTVVEHVVLSIPSTKFRSNGALLVTHWGMSGPATLKLSSYAARHLAENNYQSAVAVNWVYKTNTQLVEQNLVAIATEKPKKQMANIRPYALPTRLWEYLLHRSDIDKEKRWGELGKKALHKLVETLTNDVHKISGKGSFRDEFVTCGGVSLKSINPNTLESKVCKGLVFAGEVLDIDGITGGFNLQAAWTTGYVAGQEACV